MNCRITAVSFLSDGTGTPLFPCPDDFLPQLFFSNHAPEFRPDELAPFRVLGQRMREFKEALLGARPPVDILPTHNQASNSFCSQYQFGSNWSLVLQNSDKERNMTDLGELTASEKGYLKHGDLERKARRFFHYSGWWNTSQ